MELFKVDFGLTVWMFVAFAILLFILWKYAWPAILKGCLLYTSDAADELTVV